MKAKGFCLKTWGSTGKNYLVHTFMRDDIFWLIYFTYYIFVRAFIHYWLTVFSLSNSASQDYHKWINSLDLFDLDGNNFAMSLCFGFLSFVFFCCVVFQLPGDCTDEKKPTQNPEQLSIIFFPICIYKPGRKKFTAEQMESVQTNHYIC